MPLIVPEIPEGMAKTWEKQSESTVHPMIKNGTFLDYEIDLDKEALFEDCAFSQCAFIGKDFNAILLKCTLFNCKFPEEALNYSFMQCYITEGEDIDLKLPK